MEEKDIEPVKEQPILISTESITKEDNLVEEFLDNQDDGLLKQKCPKSIAIIQKPPTTSNFYSYYLS